MQVGETLRTGYRHSTKHAHILLPITKLLIPAEADVPGKLKVQIVETNADLGGGGRTSSSRHG